MKVQDRLDKYTIIYDHEIIVIKKIFFILEKNDKIEIARLLEV